MDLYKSIENEIKELKFELQKYYSEAKEKIRKNMDTDYKK